jgi:PAS domain S-box-containing protein
MYSSDNENFYRPRSFREFIKLNTIEFLVLAVLAVVVLYYISVRDYLLFHSLAESFSIIIACGIFMFIWNSRRHIENNYFLLIGIAYLFIGLLDLLHTFTYKGMDIFPENSANLPTQLWIASRYIQSITLLIAPLFIKKKINTYYALYTFAFITLIIIALIFIWKIFPTCYVEGEGLTAFKKISEYLISLILVAAMFVMFTKKESFDNYIFYMIEASLFVTVLSELNFSLYISVYSAFNFAGHLLKIASFYFMYKAIIVIGLQNPFNILFGRLKQKEEALELTRFSVEHSLEFILWINRDGFITDANETAIKRLNYSKKEINGIPFSQIDPDFEHKKFTAEQNTLLSREHFFITKDGDKIPVEVEIDYLEYEGKNYYCAFARDITARKKVQETLMESEARFRSLADNTPSLIWMSDIDKKRIYCNRRWMEFTGRTLDEEIGDGWIESVHPEDRSHYIKKYSNNFEERKEFDAEYRLKRYDGQYRWILDTGIPRLTSDGNFLGYIGSGYDITERRESREQMKLSLSEKVTLVKEMHHRVKNNLQIISSLLQLQSSYIKDDKAREIFIESKNRIRSMAFIHEKLYLSNDLKHIDFSDYIHELVSSLLSSVQPGSKHIEPEINIDDIQIDVDKALNVGLIVNELVSNVFKHAFPERLSGDEEIYRLYIRIKDLCNGKVILTIKDNGTGFPSNVNFRNTSTLGLQLVTALVEQLKGTIELISTKETEYNITFSI